MTSSAPAPAMRVDWVDEARGLGILLVVVGHVLGGLEAARIVAADGPGPIAIRWIYSFHMPLFFFLSGLFATRAAAGPFDEYVAGKLRTVAYPYLVWSVLQTLVHLALSRFTNQQVHATALLTLLYRPIMQFWFLYALFLIFVVFGVLVRAGARRGAVLAVALGLYVIAHVGTLGPWGVLYSVANHMLYFAVGVAVADHIHRWVAALMPGSAAAVGLLAFAGLSGSVAAGAVDNPWEKPVVAMIGIVGTVALTALVRGSGASLLRGWGARSLQIYVAHTIAAAAVRIGLQRGAGVTDPLVHLASGVVVGLYAPLWLDTVCTRVGFRYAFTWPRATEPGRAAAERTPR